jgi:CRP/FNR family transcriptional regulator
MSVAITADQLHAIPLFRGVTPTDRAHVLSVARVRHFDRGACIFKEGDASNEFSIVVCGRVKVFRTTASGKEVILEIFGCGDPLGAIAVYEGVPFPATALALEPVECLVIGRRDFFALLDTHPTIVRSLLLGLTHRMMDMTRRLLELSGGRVETRFARLFLKLAEQVGRRDAPEPGGIFIPMPLSRQELADLTGTTIETAIRIMSRWNKDDIVRTTRDGFVIVDPPALALAAAA